MAPFADHGTIALELHDEVVAYDLVQLIEASYETEPTLVDFYLDCLLQLDQEIRFENQEESLINVRREQLRAATFFLAKGDLPRATLVAADLKTERPERLQRLKSALENEGREQYWEFTDRGTVNFSYVEPERRQHLSALYALL